jgi:hypothetical protein
MKKTTANVFEQPAVFIELNPIEQVLVNDMLEKDCLGFILNPVFFTQYLIRFQEEVSYSYAEQIEEALWEDDKLLDLYLKVWDVAGGFYIDEADMDADELFVTLSDIYDENWAGNAKEAEFSRKLASLPFAQKYTAVVSQNACWKFNTTYGYISKEAIYH